MVLAVNTEKICHNDTNIAVLFCFVRKNTRSISKYNNTVLDYTPCSLGEERRDGYLSGRAYSGTFCYLLN